MARLQIRELAQARGMTISDLQFRANELTPGARLTYATISKLWHNKTKRPDLGTLAAVARALGVEAGDLIVEGVEEKSETSEDSQRGPGSHVTYAAS